MISYYMVYRGNQNLGLCFIDKYPGIRQACLLDMTSGVIGTILGVLLLFVECTTTHISNQDVCIFDVLICDRILENHPYECK